MLECCCRPQEQTRGYFATIDLHVLTQRIVWHSQKIQSAKSVGQNSTQLYKEQHKLTRAKLYIIIVLVSKQADIPDSAKL